METNRYADIFKQINEKMIDPLTKTSGSSSGMPLIPNLLGHLIVGAIVGGVVAYCAGQFLATIGMSRKAAGSLASGLFGIIVALFLLHFLKGMQ